MNYLSPEQLDNVETAKSVVGSIVVELDSVSFYAFSPNNTHVVKSYGPVPLKLVDNLKEGRKEQDPASILEAVKKCIDEVVVSGGQVFSVPMVAVGITNHRSSVLAWDKWTGEPLCNVVLSSDNRAVSMVNEYLRIYDMYMFQEICGLPFSPIFSAFKIKWLIENDPKVMSAYKRGVCYFGTVDAWLVWNLTGGTQDGVFATDSTNASNTFLMNIDTLLWDRKLIRFFGINPDCLPKILGSSEMYGTISDGLLKGVPISGVIGNRQAALVGHRCFNKGVTKVTLDATGSVFTITGENKVFSKNGLLTTIGYHLNARPIFALEGPIASAGNAIDWIEKIFGTNSVRYCTTASNKTESTRKSLNFVPAFNGLHAIYWNPNARACFYGKPGNTEQMLRSVVESVSLITADIIQATAVDLNKNICKINVDGPLGNNDFIMQSLADFTNAEVKVTKCKEMTALGAAMVAGYAPGVDVWKVMCMAEDNSFVNYVPTLERDRLDKRMYDWKRAVAISHQKLPKDTENWFGYNKYVWQRFGMVACGLALGGFLVRMIVKLI